jgi:hypothetical protein
MLVTHLITDALIKARVRKKRIIIVLVIIYCFSLLVLTNMFHKFFHEWWITVFNFFSIGGLMYFEMLYLIKFINSEKENSRLK